MLGVQSTVKENSIRIIGLFCKTAEYPRLGYFILLWSLPLSTPCSGLRTAVGKCKMSQCQGCQHSEHWAVGSCLVHADSEEAYGDNWDGSADGQ